jgi:peptide/nickel transport system permease protein
VERFQPPGPRHWFGTDDVGRDMFSRVLYGAQISIVAAATVLAIALSIGVTVGATAGAGGRWTDNLIMRVTDIFLAFPSLVLAMAVSAALGRSLTASMIAVGLVVWAEYARLVRGLFLSLRENTYVVAARSIGATQPRIILRHLLPNAMSPILVRATMDVGYAILTTASLSFVGLGAQPPTPEWGAMVTAGRTYLLVQWWYATFPGLAIFVTVLGFVLLGDALRDWLDPGLRGT